MSIIKDSGDRREFESGAVRDIVEGKGRCDLLPLDTIAVFLSQDNSTYGDILLEISKYVRSGSPQYIYTALYLFATTQYDTLYTAVLEVAKHYEQGCLKYGERNWEKGIPVHCYIDSGVRHLLKYSRGDTDEPHDRAFMWNMLGAVWTAEHYPSLIDLPIS